MAVAGTTIWSSALLAHLVNLLRFLQTAEDNYMALKDFFENVFPEYASRPFYITGESYAGIYIPMLAWRLIQGIQSEDIAINFTVVEKLFTNRSGDCNRQWRTEPSGPVELGDQLLLLSRDFRQEVRRKISVDELGFCSEWDELAKECCVGVADPVDCDFSQYVLFDQYGFLQPNPDKNNTVCFNKACGEFEGKIKKNIYV
jgi:hypothetical protein